MAAALRPEDGAEERGSKEQKLRATVPRIIIYGFRRSLPLQRWRGSDHYVCAVFSGGPVLMEQYTRPSGDFQRLAEHLLASEVRPTYHHTVACYGLWSDRIFKEEWMMSTIATQKKGPWLGGQQAAKADRPVVITDEQIRRRAHEIYLARKGKAGDPLLDWLQAEKELRARLSHR